MSSNISTTGTTSSCIPSQNTATVDDATTESPNATFDFLVHSQDTLINGLPPNVDDRPSARPRRRRTSPEDHAILEAEYGRNSKPDKTARLAIVNRVALGEKEVQIWFQNRRQMTRRKSRPLLPLEIFSSQESLEHSFSSSPIMPDSSRRKLSSQSSFHDSQSSGGEYHQKVLKVSPSDEPPSSSDANLIPSNETCPITLPKAHESTESGTTSIEGVASARSPLSTAKQDPLRSDPSSVENEPSQPPSQVSDVRENPGSLVNDCSDIPTKTSYSTPTPGVGSDASASSSRSLKRTSSSVRLSMSLDGKAQVVLENGTTPSPPRLQATPSLFGTRHLNPLKRSQSDYRPTGLSSDIAGDSVMSWPSRTVPGRSRDARTWEFYCDSDARNALTVQAEEEQKGLAEIAISIVRSSSSKISRSSSEKRTTHVNTGRENAKRKKVTVHDGQKPKLARTTSSVARLQTVSPNLPVKLPRAKVSGMKASSKPTYHYDHSGDSDKENWEPGTETSSVHRRSAVSSSDRTSRPVLGENNSIPSHSTSLGSLMNRQNVTPRRHKKISEKKGEEKEIGEVDEDVVRFMGESSLPREEDDLDCVQNLLSLSQGAWR